MPSTATRTSRSGKASSKSTERKPKSKDARSAGKKMAADRTPVRPKVKSKPATKPEGRAKAGLRSTEPIKHKHRPPRAAESKKPHEMTAEEKKTKKSSRSRDSEKPDVKISAKAVESPEASPKRAKREPKIVKSEAKTVAPAGERKRKSVAKAMPVEPLIEDALLDDPLDSKPFEPVDDFLDEDTLDVVEDEEEIIPDDLALDPLDIPLALLDPELADVTRPASPPKPKPKPARVDRRERQCAGCGNMFTWLSVEDFCFSCLKRRLAQRKRDDENYSTYTAEEEDDSES